MIEYNGYIGVVEFDPEIDSFHGTVINTNDVITFYEMRLWVAKFDQKAESECSKLRYCGF